MPAGQVAIAGDVVVDDATVQCAADFQGSGPVFRPQGRFHGRQVAMPHVDKAALIEEGDAPL